MNCSQLLRPSQPTFLRRFAGRVGEESATASDDVVASFRVSRLARCVRLAEGGMLATK
jgi:hypothetical protein